MDNKDLQGVLDKIDQDQLENRTPANFTGVVRPDARAMLREFNYNHPFYPVIQVPKSNVQSVNLDGNQQVNINLPDGTIFVWFSYIGNVVISFDGAAPLAPSLVPYLNQPVSGYLCNPPNGVGFFVYGKQQISVASSGNATLSVIAYTGEDGKLG